MRDIAIRPLVAAEWSEFRAFRLDALKQTQGEFVETLDEALARSEAKWRNLISGPIQRVFALFDGTSMIGCAGVFPFRADPSGKSAHFRMLYVMPGFRRRGLTGLLYVTRLAWVRNRPQFERIVLSHRASNGVAQHIALRHGFVPGSQKSRVWPDGAADLELFYALPMPPR